MHAYKNSLQFPTETFSPITHSTTRSKQRRTEHQLAFPLAILVDMDAGRLQLPAGLAIAEVLSRLRKRRARIDLRGINKRRKDSREAGLAPDIR
jgi:hypothetical protein